MQASRLRERLEAGQFVVSTEMEPPKGADLSRFLATAKLLKGKVHAVNVTDNQRAVMRLSSLGGSSLLIREGVEPILQVTCRDRNRLALQSDLLSAWVLGIRNVLTMTGDPVETGDHPRAKPVFDIGSTDLLKLIAQLNAGSDAAGHPLEGKTDFFCGSTVNPCIEPLELELRKFTEKVEAGARFFQTQAIYDLEAFARFMEFARRMPVDILAGLIPLRSAKMARFLNEKVPGICVPATMIDAMEKAADPREQGLAIAAELVSSLRNLCQGIHLMIVGGEKGPELFHRLALLEEERGTVTQKASAHTLQPLQRIGSSEARRRFQDNASAYQVHRSITNEADAISSSIWQYLADRVGLVRSRLRVLDAGVGDGRVLKGVLEKMLQPRRGYECDVVLKESDFHHIEAVLQNIAPMLRTFPRLAAFVTNRTFRDLQGFPTDLREENTVCFDDVAGYRLLAMVGTSSVLSQENSLLYHFPQVGETRHDGEGTLVPFTPQSDLWSAHRSLLSDQTLVMGPPALRALGDKIRAQEIYQELAAAGGKAKHFTVTIARQESVSAVARAPTEFFWDLAIASHAFNRDKEPGWIYRNILGPLCQGLSIGGVLVNIHATDRGQMGELKREIFGGAFPLHAPPQALVGELEVVLDEQKFQLLPCREISYQGYITAEEFARLEPWQRELACHQMAVSVAYHLQIPDDAWLPHEDAVQSKIRALLERDGVLSYSLSIVGIRRRE